MQKKGNSWSWVPSLYFAEGLPYVIVMTVSVIMYKDLGISNADIAFFTSWLYLPWVIKPFWSPVVDLLKTKRWWIIAMQYLIGCGLAGVAYLIPTSHFFQSSLAILWLMAFSSATHDIAADGFYMIAQSEKEQSLFVGIRNIFYRIAMVFGQGVLVTGAGFLTRYYSTPKAWLIVFLISGGLVVILSLYHWYILPKPQEEKSESQKNITNLLLTFFKKKEIGFILAYILLYRFGEAQLVKIASPFLMEDRELGGLGLSVENVGVVYGTIGVIALLTGGLLGGWAISNGGLKKWLWPMLIAMNAPNLVYVFMAIFQPQNIFIISSFVAIEQLGYGFGFTAFTLYLIYVSQGEFKTSHYAICTGLMALGMMIPGMFAGYLQEQWGYSLFFIWVCICTIPAFIIANFLKIDDSFGKKGNN